MNVLIVYAHPEPKSFNGAMYRVAVDALTTAGHAVQVSDLYAMQFNPVSDRSNFHSVFDANHFKQQLEEVHATEVNGFVPEIDAEQQKVEWCDLMIWQFPMWWFGVPAILKGWVDRVFAMGRTYGNGRFYEQGVFRGKKALLSLTTGGVEEAYLPDGFNGDAAGILRPLQRGMLGFTGFSVLRPEIIYGPARMDAAQRAESLQRWNDRLLHIAAEEPVSIGRY